MRKISAFVFLAACGRPQAATEVTVAPLPSNTTGTGTAIASASASATATATAAAPAIREMRCAAGQLNVPCVLQKNGQCFRRLSNCTGLPCTESAPLPIDCDVFTKAREANACDVVEKCRGVSDEGCRIDTGCHPQMATCIEKSCAPAIVAATRCSAIPGGSCIQ